MRRDDYDRAAEIIKEVEQRLADSEQKDRESSTPNLLRKIVDRVVVTDTVTTRTTTLQVARWNEDERPGAGWSSSTWGNRRV